MNTTHFPPIKTAVTGFGLSSQVFHIPFLEALPEFQLVALSTHQTDTAHAKYPDIKIYREAQQLIHETDASLIVIAAPDKAHHALAKQALEQGKDVIVEKPFVQTVSDGEDLIQTAQKNDCRLTVFHNRRWDRDFLTVKRLIENRVLGDILFFESSYSYYNEVNPSKWREHDHEGGIVYDLGAHLIDQMIHLFGYPDKFHSACRKLRPNTQQIDYFDILCDYPDKQVRLHADLLHRNHHQRFRVSGTLGEFSTSGFDCQEQLLKLGIKPSTPDWNAFQDGQSGQLTTNDVSTPLCYQHSSYRQYYLELAHALNNNTALPVTAEQALTNIRLIQDVLSSSLT